MQQPPALEKCIRVYTIWHTRLPHLPRHTRFTIGVKVDALFTRVIELILRSGFTPRAQKTAVLTETSIALDSLKFFLQVLWEMKALERKTYEEIAVPLVEIGKILGQWLKYANETK